MKNHPEFMHSYRAEGIKSASYAGIAVVIILILFLSVDDLSSKYSIEAARVRIAMLGTALLCLMIIRKFKSLVIRHYVLVIGSGCCGLLSGVLYILAHPNVEAVAYGYSSMPALMFSLFLIYGFLRLPLCFATIAGVLFSILAVLATPTEYTGVGNIRMFLYLGSMNILGAILLNSIQRRELKLFLQHQALTLSNTELRTRAEAAERSYLEKIRLIAAVNHDMRYPASTAKEEVRSLRKLLIQGNSAAATDRIDAMERSLIFLSHTLDYLLAVARYESSRDLIHTEDLDPREIFDQIVETFSGIAETEGIVLRIGNMPENLLVQSDRGAISQILMNLVSNALRSCSTVQKRTRGVTLSASIDGNVATIFVVDCGQGMSNSMQKSIWEPFNQLSFERPTDGLGLGMYLIQAALNRLESHSLTCWSKSGRGTRFKLRLQGRIRLGISDSSWCYGAADVEQTNAMDGAYVLVLEPNRISAVAIEDLLIDCGVLSTSVSSIEDLTKSIDNTDREIDALIIGPSIDYNNVVQKTSPDAKSKLEELVVIALLDQTASRVILDEMPYQNIRYLRRPFSLHHLIECIGIGALKNSNPRNQE